MATQLTLDDFKSSARGQTIAALLRDPAVVDKMEALSRAGRPAVLALDAALPEELHLGDSEKQHAGRMVRDRLAERGWRVGPRRQFRGGRLFSSGTIYAAAAKPPSEPNRIGIEDGDDFDTRIRKIQAFVKAHSKNDYSVDDFIADRRAEAARER